MKERVGAKEIIGTGIALAALGVGLRVGQDSQQVGDSVELQLLRDKVTVLEKELEENLVGDCINEGILRQALGAPSVDLEGCRVERKSWKDKIDHPKPEVTPTPTGA